ncbi:N-acetylglucosamine-6-phosphate deacetylase [Alteromonas mediterranea]|nr:N-acetylglucosamine-6-phosphate deacetylase [Alteromonas mediterranea]APD98543.1 N-acetylglucosamine-6-phosphate deacetylase [Alteromonas mediterranea]
MKTILAENILIKGTWEKDQVLTIENGVIANIETLSGSQTHREAFSTRVHNKLIPGFVDTQVNGGGGVMFNHAPTFKSIEIMAKAHREFGTTTLFPTLITDDIATIESAANAVSEAIESGNPSVEGIHFEGPHLSVEKKGVHLSKYIRPLTDRELATYTRKDLGKVMITVAPENTSCDVIRDLVNQGVIVALGHSNAPFEVVERAIEAGATGFTHLYNAMSPFTSREPGMVGAALLSNNTCGIIVDHQHLHPKAVELAFKTKGPSKLMLVTDAMAHVGADKDVIDFFDTHITRVGNKLTTPDGTLAGSCLDMHGAVINCVNDIGISLKEASLMASATPSAFMGINEKVGSIAVGQRANFVELSEDNALAHVWQNGEVCV